MTSAGRAPRPPWLGAGMIPGKTGLRTEGRAQSSSLSPHSLVLSPHGSVPRAQRSVLTAQSSSLSPLTPHQAVFTFVEIMIVLVVIGILVTLAPPSFTTSVQRAREAALRENLFVLRDVIDQHYADNGTYPPALE